MTVEFTKGFSMKMSHINIICLETNQIAIKLQTTYKLQTTQQTIVL